jgi:hypothetical protein
MQCANDLQRDRDRYRQFYDEWLPLNTSSTQLDRNAVTWCLSQLAHLCIYPYYYFLRFIVRPVEYRLLSYTRTMKSPQYTAYICPCIFGIVFAAKLMPIKSHNVKLFQTSLYSSSPHSVFSISRVSSFLLYQPAFFSLIPYFTLFVDKIRFIKKDTMKIFEGLEIYLHVFLCLTLDGR